MNSDGRSKKNGQGCQQPIIGGNDFPDAWSAVCVLRYALALHREAERVSGRAQALYVAFYRRWGQAGGTWSTVRWMIPFPLGIRRAI